MNWWCAVRTTRCFVSHSSKSPRDAGVDLAVQRAGLHRRAKHLVVMDADSTLLQDEVIDLLADECGCAAEVSAITELAMSGEIDFAEALRRRVALLADCRRRSWTTCALDSV